MRLWREFRAWVEIRKAVRERALIERIQAVLEGGQLPEYAAGDVISIVRRHDNETRKGRI